MLRRLLIQAADSSRLRRFVSSTRLPRSIAMRYIAGETLDDGLRVARELTASGRMVTLDYLGESVTDESDARTSAKVVLEALSRIGDEGLPAGMSVKPTAMGLGMPGGGGEALCRELLTEIAAASDSIGAHLTLDMEGSSVTEATVRLVEELRAGGYDVGCAVQSYLYRTLDDCRRLSEVGASLRLCKGAYLEPAEVAYTDRSKVDANYARCAELLLADGVYPRIATHDDRLIAHVQAASARLGVERGDFEFQMLYGVRSSLQEQLVDEGWRLRVYVPFGRQWYPYFMRRLAERPANLLFFLRALRDT